MLLFVFGFFYLYLASFICIWLLAFVFGCLYLYLSPPPVITALLITGVAAKDLSLEYLNDQLFKFIIF